MTIAQEIIDELIAQARRDEEKSRAKERFFSHRDEFGQWNPKNQRPELWNIFNGRIVEWDDIHGLIEVNPLFNWSEEEVRDYIHKNHVPYNKLFDKGFPSIGCEPCTRAVKPGDDPRSGRWWWEAPDKRECGLHQRY